MSKPGIAIAMLLAAPPLLPQAAAAAVIYDEAFSVPVSASPASVPLSVPLTFEGPGAYRVELHSDASFLTAPQILFRQSGLASAYGSGGAFLGTFDPWGLAPLSYSIAAGDTFDRAPTDFEWLFHIEGLSDGLALAFMVPDLFTVTNPDGSYAVYGPHSADIGGIALFNTTQEVLNYTLTVYDDVPVPEPTTLAMFGLGIAGAVSLRRMRLKAAGLRPA